ncbi:MAG TPA: hypothetical protein VE088_09005 [Gaiellaceae bacterium]|jgi:hypothetical protein|nr:hypothetical protein [Gaiellaceae bacterium]
MATHAGYSVRPPGLAVHELVAPRRLNAGVTIGLIGGLTMAVPLVVYDWVHAGHSALELPMAVTGWLFGLGHFVQNGYQWWPIVVGAALLAAYSMVSGLVFSGLADRVFSVRTLAGSLAAGVAWGIASFVVFWDVLLAIARDGAPFRATAASSVLVAPNWVWIVGFVAFGIAHGLAYRAIRDHATT